MFQIKITHRIISVIHVKYKCFLRRVFLRT